MKFVIATANSRRFFGLYTGAEFIDLTAEWSWSGNAWNYPTSHPFDQWSFGADGQTDSVNNPHRESNMGGFDPVTKRRVYPAREVKIEGPAPMPRQVFGIARNYYDWVQKSGGEIPGKPQVFGKWLSTLCGHEKTVHIPQGVQTTYEAEIGVIMAKKAYRVPASDALAYVAGYTVFNDFTAVNLVREDKNLQRAKNLGGFGAWGPYLSVGEWDGRKPLHIELRVNNFTRQSSDTTEMIFSVPELISYISTFTTLWPGDLIATGSPAGVAQQWEPPCYLQDGDVVEAEVEGFGILINYIKEIEPFDNRWRLKNEG